MKGIVLAGGTATRLYPLTIVTNKHLLPIYDRPMIYYPIETLASMGIREVLVIVGGKSVGDVVELLADGSHFGLDLTYRYQRGALGILELLLHAAVAALAVGAVRALSTGLASAVMLARAAVVASALATIQSQYWSVLPHQTMPGDELPLAVGAVLHAGGWLVYLARSRRIRAMS